MKRKIIFVNILIILVFSHLEILSQDKLYTIDELVGYSNAIVLGKVIKITSWFGGDGRIYSDIKVQVSKVYKGNIKQKQELSFRLLGGTIGSRTTLVAEYPHFSENSESILFLNKFNDSYDESNAFVFRGGAQGKFDIVEENNTKKIFRDRFMSNNLIMKYGNEIRIVSNKKNVLLSEFVSQIESLNK